MGTRIRLPARALGMFERLGVRRAFRKAKLRESGTDPKLGIIDRGGTPGADAATRGRVISQEESWQRAGEARDRLIAQWKAGRERVAELRKKPRRSLTAEEGQELNRLQQEYASKRTVATGATDPETGLSGAGFNHFDPQTTGYPASWKCAERAAFEDVNRQRIANNYGPTRPDRLEYSEATDLKTNGDKPIDTACQRQIPPHRFPDGTRYFRGTGDQRVWARKESS